MTEGWREKDREEIFFLYHKPVRNGRWLCPCLEVVHTRSLDWHEHELELTWMKGDHSLLCYTARSKLPPFQ